MSARLSRGGEAVSRSVHTRKIVGATPTSATNLRKKRQMKTILIDPKERSFTEIEHDNSDYKNIARALGCDLFDVVRLNDCDIYVDDEGLYNNDYFFIIDGIDQPLAGRGLVFGVVDDEGENTPCTLNIEDLEKRVRFTTRQDLMAELF